MLIQLPQLEFNLQDLLEVVGAAGVAFWGVAVAMEAFLLAEQAEEAAREAEQIQALEALEEQAWQSSQPIFSHELRSH